MTNMSNTILSPEEINDILFNLMECREAIGKIVGCMISNTMKNRSVSLNPVIANLAMGEVGKIGSAIDDIYGTFRKNWVTENDLPDWVPTDKGEQVAMDINL